MTSTWESIGLSATIATALSTGISTVAALWWRRQDRAEADWAWFPATTVWDTSALYGPPQGPTAHTGFANAGDGTGFRVSASGERCGVRMVRAAGGNSVGIGELPVPFVPAMRPGEEVRIRVECDIDDWDAAVVVVEWTRAPTWKGKKRTLRVDLRELADKPTPS